MSLSRHFITVGLGTAASRILGFGRDIAIAAALGTGPVADAFFVAFRLPNLFRRIFSEGAFNSAFVPLYGRVLDDRGPEAARLFAGRVMAAMTMLVIAVSILCIVFMPALVLAIAPGFHADPEKFALTVRLTRIAFPYLACMMVLALFSAILNAHHRFGASSFAPVLLNIVLIVAIFPFALAGERGTELAGLVLAFAVSVAGVAQVLVAWVALRRAGLGLGTTALRWPFPDADVRRLWISAIPGIIAGGAAQVNIVIGTIVASLEASAVSWLYYADRVYQLPLGIVGVAMGVVLLPDMARQLREGDAPGLATSQSWALRLSLVLTVPAAAALMVIAGEVVRVLFERGAFTGLDTRQTAAALAVFAGGLPAFVLVKVLTANFFAREDTLTPMHAALVSIAVNIAVSVLLFPRIGHLAVAWGTTLSGWLNAAVLMVIMVRRGYRPMTGADAVWLPRLIGAVVAMTAILWGLARWLAPYFGPQHGTMVAAAALTVLILAGLASFALTAIGLRVVAPGDLRALIGKRDQEP